MNKAIKLIKYLIKEHEKEGFCTTQEQAEEWIERYPVRAFDKFFELGRYETLVDLLDTLEKLGE